jgi:hypothetical protein
MPLAPLSRRRKANPSTVLGELVQTTSGKWITHPTLSQRAQWYCIASSRRATAVGAMPTHHGHAHQHSARAAIPVQETQRDRAQSQSCASIRQQLRTGSWREARWRGRGHGRARHAGLRHGRRCRCRDRLLGGLRRDRTDDLCGPSGADVAEDHTKRSHGDYRADTDSRRPQLPLCSCHRDHSIRSVIRSSHRARARREPSAERDNRSGKR